MSLQSELKLPWPETTIHFPAPDRIIPETKLAFLWKDFVAAFHGKYSRFTSYLMYLSTDFSGGFKVCSVLGPNPSENTFPVPFTPPGPPISIDLRDQIWKRAQKRDWEELSREDWELLGISFLLTGDITDFSQWMKMTKKEFGLSVECQKFLFILGWEKESGPVDNTILQALVDYSNGDYENTNFEFLSNAVLKEGHWQLSGVLLDAISKNAWSGNQIFPFLNFVTGFYSDWQEWEKEKFLKISLGKVPPFVALKKAKKVLKPDEYLAYAKNLKHVFRGTLEDEDKMSTNRETSEMDPFIDTLVRFEREGETYFRRLLEHLKATPYSYFVNLQMAVLYYKSGDFTRFLEYYEKGGRLRYLSVPLYLYAKVKESRKEETLAESIFQTLENLQKTPIFPSELGEI